MCDQIVYNAISLFRAIRSQEVLNLIYSNFF